MPEQNNISHKVVPENLRLKQPELEPEKQRFIQPEYGGDVLFDLMEAENIYSTPLGSWVRNKRFEALGDEGDLIQTKELNDLYRDRGYVFTSPLTRAQADELIKYSERQSLISESIANAKDAWYNPFVKLGGVAATYASDPLGIAAGVLTGGVFRAAGLVGTSILGRVGYGTLENFVGNVALDAPFLPTSPIRADDRYQQEYSVTGYLLSQAAGAALVPAGVGLVRGLRAGLKSRVAAKVVDDVANGKVPDPSPHIDQVARERSGIEPPSRPPRVGSTARQAFEPLHPDHVGGRRFFMASMNEDPAGMSDFAAISDNSRGLLEATDAPGTANGTAGSRYESPLGTGALFEVSTDGKFLSYTQALDDKMFDQINSKYDGKLPESLRGKTLDDIFKYVEEQSLDDGPALQAVREAGYDGLIKPMKTFAGRRVTPQNVLQIFPEASEKLRYEAVHRVDKEAVPEVAGDVATEVEARTLSDDDTIFSPSRETIAEFEAQRLEPPKPLPEAVKEAEDLVVTEEEKLAAELERLERGLAEPAEGELPPLELQQKQELNKLIMEEVAAKQDEIAEIDDAIKAADVLDGCEKL